MRWTDGVVEDNLRVGVRIPMHPGLPNVGNEVRVFRRDRVPLRMPLPIVRVYRLAAPCRPWGRSRLGTRDASVIAQASARHTWGPVKSALRAYHGAPVKAAAARPPTGLRPRGEAP